VTKGVVLAFTQVRASGRILDEHPHTRMSPLVDVSFDYFHISQSRTGLRRHWHHIPERDQDGTYRAQLREKERHGSRQGLEIEPDGFRS
jgi:hypothetical protein